MLPFLDHPLTAIVFNLTAAVLFLWMGYAERGLPYRLFVWYAEWRYQGWQSPERLARRSARWLFLIAAGLLLVNAARFGAREIGLIPDKPPISREEFQQARTRFEEVRRQRQNEAQGAKNAPADAL
jgi:hypothetical protein